MGYIFLFTLLNLSSNSLTYIVALVIAALVIAFLAVMSVTQNKERKSLERALVHLNGLNRQGVEHELVLQAMKLASWKYDVENGTFTIENDYRPNAGVVTYLPGTAIEMFYDSVHPKDVTNVRDKMEKIVTGETELADVQYRVNNGNDEWTWAQIYAMAADRDDDGRPTVIVGASLNIDKQKRMEHDIIEARRRAEESDRLKSAFINNISHEVRTPLNAIIGFSDILTTVTDKAEHDHLVAIIKENNSKLLTIFEDVMNISKVEADNDRESLNIEKFDVLKVVEEEVSHARTKNTNDSLIIDYLFHSRQMMVESDRERVQYIVKHYLANAMKFTRHGNITTGVKELENGFLRIWVSDTGIGIPEEAKERIFDRFYKVDSFVQGAGLGLAVCRHYALSLDGNVGMESHAGQGSTFWVDIPVSAGAAKD